MKRLKKNEVISELSTEMKHRRTAWPRVATTQHVVEFIGVEHQRRYDIILDLSEMLECVTEFEWNTFLARMEERRAAAARQTKLF